MIRIDGVEHRPRSRSPAPSRRASPSCTRSSTSSTISTSRPTSSSAASRVLGGPLRLVDRAALSAEGGAAARCGSASTSSPTRRSPTCRSPSASSSRSPRRCRSTPASSSWTSRPRASPPPRRTRLLKVIAELKAGGRRHHLHLAPPERGRAVRRPRRGAARRRAWSANWRAARSRTTRMIRMMIGRDLKSLYMPPERAARRRGARDRRPADRRLSRPRGRPVAARAARSSAWPAWSAPAAPSSPAPSSASTAGSAARLRLDGEPVAIALAARRHRRTASSWSRRTASAPGLVLDVSVTEQHLARRTLRPSPRGLLIRTGSRAPQRRAQQRALDIRTRLDRHRWSAPCRAATSRRWCWPSGCR